MASMCLMDLVYTRIYNVNFNRNKIQLAINGRSGLEKKLDVAILGSSRAENHFVTSEFENESLRAYNFGNSGSKPEEQALLLLCLLKNRYKIETVLLEADMNLADDSHSEGNRAMFMPHIRKKYVRNYYRGKLDDLQALVYLPFYRFMRFDKVIGLRETLFALLNKPNKYLRDGFVPLYGEGFNMNYNIENLTPGKNKGFDFIRRLCKENQIELIIVTTPVCEETIGKNYFRNLTNVYPMIYRYDTLFRSNQFFASCGHLNSSGAKILTKTIIKNHFKSNKGFEP